MATILYAEDEENDVFFLQRAFEQARSPHTLKAVCDGAQAIEYLAGQADFADRQRNPLPVLVLLDINMPKKTGLEALAWLRQQPQFKSLAVLMFTSSTRPEDMEKANQLGANDYILKPSDPLKLGELVKAIHDRWLSKPTGPQAAKGESHALAAPAIRQPNELRRRAKVPRSSAR